MVFTYYWTDARTGERRRAIARYTLDATLVHIDRKTESHYADRYSGTAWGATYVREELP